MNRPLIFITIFYIVGIICAFTFFEKIFFYFSLSVCAIILFLIYIFLKKNYSYIIFVLFFLLGFILYYFQNIYLPGNHIKNFRDISSMDSFDCVVSEMPSFKDEKIYFSALLENIYINNKKYEGISGKIRVTVESKFNLQLRYGDLLNIKGKLKIPGNKRNEGEFDYKKYLEMKKIFFIVYTDDTRITITGRKIYNPLIYFAGKVKEKFINCIYKSIPTDEAKILEGLLLGNQKAIPEEIYDSFKKTGTAHILAVSGMNVGLISFFVFLFLKIINVPQKISAVLILFFIWIFALITGFDASVVRASIMASFALFGLVIERDVDLLNILFSSALLILLFKTADLLDIGFQLSYLATFGIVYFIDYVKNFKIKLPDYIKEILFATITAQIFIVPVMINNFHQLSIISLLANFFIVPLSGLITVLGFAMWFIFFIWEQGAKFFGASIFILIKIMLFIVDILSKIPYAAISVKTLPHFFIFVYYLFFIILPYDDVDFELKKISFKKATGLLLILFFLIFVFYPEKKIKFYALSVPGTNCVFVNTDTNKKIFIIAYDKNKEITGMRNTVIPFLRYKGINNIDFLIIYSLQNEKNIKVLTDNFYIKRIIRDFENINEVIDKDTQIFINSNETEISYKDKKIYFQKILAEKTGNNIIYCCFYKDEVLEKMALAGNKCFINTENVFMFKKKRKYENENIFDVGKDGMKVIVF